MNPRAKQHIACLTLEQPAAGILEQEQRIAALMADIMLLLKANK